MSKVNPPPSLRIPPTLAQLQDTRVYFEQINRILFQLWTRTGGGNDTVSDLEDSALYDVGIKGAEIAEIIKQIEELRVQIAFSDGMEQVLISALSPQEVYMQDAQPSSTGKPFLWVQTGLPGGGISLWADDGN